MTTKPAKRKRERVHLRMNKRTPAEVRFMRHVAVDAESGCWNWTGQRLPAGYGKFGGGRWHESMLAHRWAFQQWRGPLVDGMQIDHACRNTGCVNPAHLEQVTSRENNVRAVPFRARMHTADACVNGHPWTEASTYRTAKGGRNCRTCRNASMIAYKARKRAERAA